MAADKSDEPGVLGNLPRSRPGHRSAKRGGGSRTAAMTATGATGAGAKHSRKPAARKPATRKPSPATARKPSPASARKPAAAKQPAAAPPPERGPTDPLTGAVRLAGKVAEAGIRTAGELLKRLPGR